MKLEATDYGLQELLACAEGAPELWVKTVQDRLRDWYYKWTRLETLEETLKPGASQFQEMLVSTALKSAFGGHLRDSGAAVQTVEHFSAESVHSLQCRVVLPPVALADASEGRKLAQRMLGKRVRGR